MAASRSLYHAANFVISCGTVTLDLQHSKALLIRYRNPKGGVELLLPKGRKNVGETLERAALRETLEETGYQTSLLPLPVPTRATSDEGFERPTLVTEPVSVMERTTGDVRKIIFWFAACADSTSPPQGQSLQEGEDYDAVWADYTDAENQLTFESDREVLKTVIGLARCLP